MVDGLAWDLDIEVWGPVVGAGYCNRSVTHGGDAKVNDIDTDFGLQTKSLLSMR